MFVTFLLLSIVAFVDSTPQFGFGGFGNSQNCLGSRCNQNNLGGGGFGGFGGFGGGFGGFGGYGGLGGFGGHSQNCAGSQCNQNNFGKKKREAVVDGDIEDELNDTKSEEITHLTELPTPNVEGNVSDTDAKEAEEQVSRIEDDNVSTDDTKAKLTEISFFEEMDPYTVVVEPLLGDMVDTSAVLETLGDDLVEAFVHEVELEEEIDRAEEVLDAELETLLESRSFDLEPTKTSENVDVSEAVDVVSVEPEETSTGGIDETTEEQKNMTEEVTGLI